MENNTIDELKNRKVWMLWKKQERSGKTSKMPFSAAGKASGTNETYRDTWVSYEAAAQAVKAQKADGVGFKIPNGLELYIGELTNRFAAFTGNVIADKPFRDCTQDVRHVLNQYMKKPAKIRAASNDSEAMKTAGTNLDKQAEAVIRRLKKAAELPQVPQAL